MVLPVFGFADHGLGHSLDAEETVGSEVLHRAVRHAKSTVSLRVLPPLRFVSERLFGIDPETAHEFVREIARSVQAAGFKKLVFWVTSPWNEQFIEAASRDTRVSLGLQTFVINLAGFGLSFHTGSDTRANLQAIVTQLTGRAPESAEVPPAGNIRGLLARRTDRRPLKRMKSS